MGLKFVFEGMCAVFYRKKEKTRLCVCVCMYICKQAGNKAETKRRRNIYCVKLPAKHSSNSNPVRISDIFLFYK